MCMWNDGGFYGFVKRNQPGFVAFGDTVLYGTASGAVASRKQEECGGGICGRVSGDAALVLACDGSLYSFCEILQFPYDGGLVYGTCAFGCGSGSRAFPAGLEEGFRAAVR